MKARCGAPAEELPPDHAAWALEAHYLALGIANLALTLSPKRVILGGGVPHQSHVFVPVRTEFLRLLNGYVRHPAVVERIDKYIVPPELGDRAGALGALLLGRQAAESARAMR